MKVPSEASKPTGSNSLSDRFSEIWVDLEPALQEYRREVNELRDSVDDGEYGESLATIHQRLVSQQRALHRIEAILADVGFVRARLRKMVNELSDAYDDAWRAAFNKSRTGEYMSAKEKDASYATAAANELIALRRGKRWLEDAEAVYELVRLKYEGLNAAHRGTETRVRLSVREH